MGFKKSVEFNEVRVPLLVNTYYEETKELQRVEVAHIFKVPTPEVRVEWQRRLLQVKGKKIKTGSRSSANWYLWIHSVLSVEGYDDLPKTEQWKEYFTDPIGRIHVDDAVDALMTLLGAEEPEEKKLEESSELSSLEETE